MDYKEQLLDKRWKIRRLKILIRDRFTCYICGYMGDKVNVHHLKYTGMAWDAPNEDLITLCGDCHRKIHWDEILRRKDHITSPLKKWLKDLSTRVS